MKEVFYYYDYELFYVNTNVKKHIKYNLLDSGNRIYFNYYIKKNNEIYIINVVQIDFKIFKIKEEKNKIKSMSTISYSKLLKIINSTDGLNFVLKYIDKKNNNLISYNRKYTYVKIRTNKVTGNYSKTTKKIKNGKTIITTSKNFTNSDIEKYKIKQVNY